MPLLRSPLLAFVALPLLLLACGDIRLGPSNTGSASSTGGGGESASSASTTTTTGAGGGSACPATTWVKRFGEVGHQRVEALAVDAACSLILAAEVTGTVDYGNGPLSGKFYKGSTLAKIAPDGHARWSRWLESTKGPLGIGALVVDPEGNLFLTGVFSGTFDFGAGPMIAAEHGSVYVARLDPQGSVIWARHFDPTVGTNAHTLTVHRAEDGTLLVTGTFFGSIDFGDGPMQAAGEDIFLLRLDAEGETLWSKRFGGPGNTLDQVASADLGPGGVIAITGTYEGALDLGAGPLPWSYGGVFVATLDAKGDALWSAPLPGTACGYNDCLTRLAVDPAGKLTVFGSRQIDPAHPDQIPGLFQRTFGSDGTLEASHDQEGRWIHGFSRATDGSWVLAGQLGDRAVSRVSDSPSTLWNDGLMSPENLGDRAAGGQAVAVDPGGNLVVAGAFHGTMELAGTTLTSVGKHDLFVARLPLP